MSKKLLKVLLDYDDVLAMCNAFALEIINSTRNPSEPFDVRNIKGFGYDDGTLEERIKFFNDPEFVMAQPLFPGAKEFIHELSKKVEIFIGSAVPPQCMSARAMRVVQDFPEIKPENIILGTSKHIYDVDVMLDDSPRNFLKSNATYPVLMRRPWNEQVSGILAVNNYEDFLHLIDTLVSADDEPDLSSGGILCLVGPSGSGKNTITENLIQDNRFEKPIATTTREKHENENENNYNFISEKEFIVNSANFVETTVYGGYHYGISAEQIDNIISQNKIAVLPCDICGGITIKNKYRSKALLVFVDRTKQDIILNILKKSCSDEQKALRIVSLENEFKNETLCDITVRNDGNIDDVAAEIKKIIF